MIYFWKKICLLIAFSFIATSITFSQNNSENYDFELPSNGLYDRIKGLPDPFLKSDGSRVKTKKEWEDQKKYIKSMLEFYQYGERPPVPSDIKVEETLSEDIYGGTATKKLYTLTFERKGETLILYFGLIKPKGEGPFPIIIKNDKEINDIPDRISQEAIEREYIMAQFVRTDLGSDIRGIRKLEENRDNGVFLLYPEYSWGTIAAWAWGYSLLIDYFENVEFVDVDKIVATGHSRGGKTAFAAGIYDERIAITAPNSSGLGGTASHRYFELGKPEQNIGYHVINHSYWWTSAYYELAGYEPMIPFDAHFGKAVIAPRGFVNPHGLQDYHANPFGTYLTHKAAKKVYQWLGAEDNIALHWRTGGHAQGITDWLALLDFADKYFYEKEVESEFDYDAYPTVRLPIYWDVPSKQ